MKFEQSINEGYAKKIPPDIIKAKSLFKSSEQAVFTAKKIPFESSALKSIFRELYEGLREYCEALGYIKGYKFSSHEVITYFLEDVLKKPQISAKFDRYRKLRNGINYYGNDISEETVKEALQEIPLLVIELERHYSLHPRKIALLFFTEDPASMNVRQQFVHYKLPSHVFAHTVLEIRPIFADSVFLDVPADFYIFVTKHSSAAGVPSLTVHPPGNWFANDLGGDKATLGVAPALFLVEGLLKLEEINQRENLQLEVVQECTHHGPTFSKPVLFIEIGSGPEQYGNQQYGKAIAETIFTLISSPIEKNLHKKKIAFGIGGTHYTPNFKKLILQENYAFGHVCPKYQLEHLSLEMVQQALEKTVPAVEEIVVDWKGVSGYKEKLNEFFIFFEKKGIGVRKI